MSESESLRTDLDASQGVILQLLFEYISNLQLVRERGADIECDLRRKRVGRWPESKIIFRLSHIVRPRVNEFDRRPSTRIGHTSQCTYDTLMTLAM